MTSWLTDERQEVADLLTEAGFSGTVHVPSVPLPPLAMVLPGSPYLDEGELFGERAMRLDIWVVAGQGDTPSLADGLDEQIAGIVQTLEGDGITVESVAQPITWKPANGSENLVSIISVRLLVRPPALTT
ncbi:hypothetical protein E5344_12200 [Microbacterium laevaniformans]|uniref:DUF3168 domain-containing protein n=1 Tax=Microbacterium laevaniformans TaxID=36807 RepID=A0A4V3RJB7_9MICO|nr:hypothetical protein [Microbacterium laevaniformans]TGY35040.1 hypothetical protein E5344_12200 [Microbacterium laevaniformans]